MKGLVKDIVYAGVGAVCLTREKVEDIVSEMVEKGKLRADEGKELVESLIKKTEQSQEQLEEWLLARVDEKLKKLSLAKSDELVELKQEFAELKKEIAELKESLAR